MKIKVIDVTVNLGDHDGTFTLCFSDEEDYVSAAYPLRDDGSDTYPEFIEELFKAVSERRAELAKIPEDRGVCGGFDDD